MQILYSEKNCLSTPPICRLKFKEAVQHCNSLQHTATTQDLQTRVLQHTATCCYTSQPHTTCELVEFHNTLQLAATQCNNTLPANSCSATHCNLLLRATHCNNTLPANSCSATHTTYCNLLQHTATTHYLRAPKADVREFYTARSHLAATTHTAVHTATRCLFSFLTTTLFARTFPQSLTFRV